MIEVVLVVDATGNSVLERRLKAATMAQSALSTAVARLLGCSLSVPLNEHEQRPLPPRTVLFFL